MASLLTAQDLSGNWIAELQSGGGPVPFGLQLEQEGETVQAFVTNGPETIKIPQVKWDGKQLRLGFDFFNSAIEATLSADRQELAGRWTRWKGDRQVAQLRFTARRRSDSPRFAQPVEAWLGKYRVKFSGSAEQAIGVFQRDQSPGSDIESVIGTFLTPTGDYRYLSGGIQAGELQLSCFDGAHVYLFRCRRDGEKRLNGDFWSGATSHQTWSGERDDSAELPDGFQLTRAVGEADWGALQFPDLEGRPRRLDEPEYAGQVRLIYLFGSWCPNCHDAAVFFGELNTAYAGRGLKVLGLAFEATGDFQSDSEQVRIYQQRHSIQYPLLIAGVSDKEIASRSLPFLDRVRSFPTAILVDSRGRVREVYTGFNGPATGKAYELQGQKFRERIDSLLNEKPR